MNLNNEIERLSLLDALTGIANRRMFEQTLGREWSRARRNKIPLSIMMIDIDHFKQYNDCYGHVLGDKCLKLVAQTLKKVIRRDVDFVARYGGEEFVILLAEMDSHQAMLLARKCCQAISALRLVHERSENHGIITISVGVSSQVPSQKSQPMDLLDRADKLLYQAKENGRNRVEHD